MQDILNHVGTFFYDFAYYAGIVLIFLVAVALKGFRWYILYRKGKLTAEQAAQALIDRIRKPENKRDPGLLAPPGTPERAYQLDVATEMLKPMEERRDISIPITGAKPVTRDEVYGTGTEAEDAAKRKAQNITVRPAPTPEELQKLLAKKIFNTAPERAFQDALVDIREEIKTVATEIWLPPHAEAEGWLALDAEERERRSEAYVKERIEEAVRLATIAYKGPMPDKDDVSSDAAMIRMLKIRLRRAGLQMLVGPDAEVVTDRSGKLTTEGLDSML